MSWLNDGIGWTDRAELCWSSCLAKYEDALVAIDWWPADTWARGCWCQNECQCMDPAPDEDKTGGITIVRSDIELPVRCNDPGRLGVPPRKCFTNQNALRRSFF